MTTTVIEPVELTVEEPVVGCEGRTMGEGESWDHYVCSSRAEVARIKRCDCIVLNCMPCRDKIKDRIESEIARLGGRRNFFCMICATTFRGAGSYWDLVIREVPL